MWRVTQKQGAENRKIYMADNCKKQVRAGAKLRPHAHRFNYEIFMPYARQYSSVMPKK